MRNIIVAIFILCGFIAQSQILTPVTPTTFGIHQQRAKFDSAAHLPEKQGLLMNTTDSTFQLFYNVLDSAVYGFTKYTGFFKIGRNVSDSLQLSDSIWQRNDSVFYKANKVEKFSGIVLQPIQWTDPAIGDHNVIGADLRTIVNQHPTDQQCNNSSSIGLAYEFGTTYGYNSGPYSISCVQYTIPVSGTISAAVGTAGPGEFREDLVYLNQGGIHIRQGTNSIGGVGLRLDPDPATEIGVGYIRIDSNASVATVNNTQYFVYRNNDPGGVEFTHTVTGTATVVFNYTVNPYPDGADSSIRITAIANNAAIMFAHSGSISSSTVDKFSMRIRNNAAFNNARNWVVRKYLGANQVAGSAAITLTPQRGYVKNLLNTWQVISFDFSDFGGSDAFDRIQVRNTGTGGTVNEQMDLIKIESGTVVTIPSAATGVTSIFKRNDSVFSVTNNTPTFAFLDDNGTGLYLPLSFAGDNTVTTNDNRLTIQSSTADHNTNIIQDRDNIFLIASDDATHNTLIQVTYAGTAWNYNNGFIQNRMTIGDTVSFDNALDTIQFEIKTLPYGDPSLFTKMLVYNPSNGKLGQVDVSGGGGGGSGPDGFNGTATGDVTANFGVHSLNISADDLTNVGILGIGATPGSTNIGWFDDASTMGGYISFTQSISVILNGSSRFNISFVPVFADNTAAAAGGMNPGDLYRTGDILKIAH